MFVNSYISRPECKFFLFVLFNLGVQVQKGGNGPFSFKEMIMLNFFGFDIQEVTLSKCVSHR